MSANCNDMCNVLCIRNATVVLKLIIDDPGQGHIVLNFHDLSKSANRVHTNTFGKCFYYLRSEFYFDTIWLKIKYCWISICMLYLNYIVIFAGEIIKHNYYYSKTQCLKHSFCILILNSFQHFSPGSSLTIHLSYTP